MFLCRCSNFRVATDLTEANMGHASVIPWFQAKLSKAVCARWGVLFVIGLKRFKLIDYMRYSDDSLTKVQE